MVACLCLVMSLLAAEPGAQSLRDHLEPVPSVFAGFEAEEYDLALARLLLAHTHRDVQMVVLPSFTPEYAVYVNTGLTSIWIDEAGKEVRTRSQRPTIVSVRPKSSLWGAMNEFLAKEGDGTSWSLAVTEQHRALDALRLEVEVKEVPISEATLLEIKATWLAALKGTRHPLKERTGRDGTTYRFLGKSDHRTLEGQVWSPQGRMAELAALGERMIRLAAAPADARTKLEADLVVAARELRKRLK